MNELSAVASFFREGGAFMYIILGTGVLIAAIVVERLIVIGRSATVNSKRMMEDITRAIASGDLLTARNISAQSSAPAARVAQSVLRVADGDENRMQAAADDAATLALPGLTRRLPHLNMLANAATLLGLLGTIFGLMTAFAAVGAADPSQRSAFLAAGIAQALNTTAFGLIVAVPTLLIHGWLVGLVEGIAEQIDEMGIQVVRAVSLSNSTRGAGRVTALPTAAVQPIAAAPRAGTQGGAR